MKKRPIFVLAFLCFGGITTFSGYSKEGPKPGNKIMTIIPGAEKFFNANGMTKSNSPSPILNSMQINKHRQEITGGFCN